MKILKTINIEDVFPISLCSRKMYHLVKNFRDKSIPLILRIDGEDLSVQVITPDGNYHQVEVIEGTCETAEQVNINGHQVPIDRSIDKWDWMTYWDDKEEGIHSVVEYLSDLYGVKKINKITMNHSEVWLLSYIEKRQENDYELELQPGLSEEDCHFILKNYHPKIVWILWSSPGNFAIAQYMNSIESLFSLCELPITLDDVLNMNCVDLVLQHNEFTESEIKRLLQHWAIGGLRRLKYFSLYVKDAEFNMNHVLGDLVGLSHSRMTKEKKYK
ncbi:hypothetical protein CRE_27785 [Caenorhabditis remanei]|uniref:Sdz-33 F-box domain-containing protein n=1 Tax=Caenorhabditis remanei TaxID=31234 RepID=E3N5G5_CAERE|nr:hypothetical protein CRE_27785 [Caenorhabditis remanei]